MSENDSSATETKTKVVFFDVAAWQFRFGFIGFALSLLAGAVPQWIYTVPDSVTFGLRATCYGDSCQALDFDRLRSTLNCNGACDDALDQFRLRWRAIEGFSWMGVALMILLAGCLRIAYTRPVRPQAVGVPHIFLTICIVMALGVSLAIMGGTLSCGTGCFEYGASVICKLIAFALVFIALPVGLSAAKFEKHRAPLCRVAFGIVVLALAFEMAGLLSNRWIFTTDASKKGVLNGKQIGLFQTCVDSDCSVTNYADLLKPGGSTVDGCPRSADELESRFTAGYALHFVAGAFCLMVMFASMQQVSRKVRIPLILFTFIISTAANGVIFVTLESWMFCEQTYCGVVSRLGNNTACEWGFSAACALCVNICLGLLFIMEIVELLYQTCGAEETEGEGLLRLQQQEAFERKEAARIEREEAERQQRKEEAAEKLRIAVAEREEADRLLREKEDAEAEEREKADAAAALAAAAAAAIVVTSDDEKTKNDDDENNDHTAVEVEHDASVNQNNSNVDTAPDADAAEEGNNEPFEEESKQQQDEEEEEQEQEQDSASAQQQQLSVADKVASGVFVPVHDRAAVFEQQEQQPSGSHRDSLTMSASALHYKQQEQQQQQPSGSHRDSLTMSASALHYKQQEQAKTEQNEPADADNNDEVFVDDNNNDDEQEVAENDQEQQENEDDNEKNEDQQENDDAVDEEMENDDEQQQQQQQQQQENPLEDEHEHQQQEEENTAAEAEGEQDENENTTSNNDNNSNSNGNNKKNKKNKKRRR